MARDHTPKTLFITNDFPPRIGGFQSYYFGLVQALAPEDIVIMAPSHPGAASFDKSHPYRVERTKEPVVLPHGRNLERAAHLAQEHGAELVLLGHPLPAGLLGPRLKKRLGLPYAVLLGGAEVTFPATWPVAGQLLRYVMCNASLFIAVSDYTAQAATRLVRGRVRACTLRPALDVDSFPEPSERMRLEARRALGIEGRLVVCVGRLVPRKGQDVLVEAVARLVPDMPDLSVCLIGQGRLAYRLKRRVEYLGIADRVFFPGALPREGVLQWLAAGDVFASPCRVRWGGLEVEGFGIVFVEAALMGLPVLAGRSGGSVEAVVPGETGVIVDGNSVDEVSAGLRRLLEASDCTRRTLGAAGRGLALRRHNPAIVGARFRELLALAAWGQEE